MEMTAVHSASRKTYLDLLRIGAAFLVILNHVPGYMLSWTTSGMKAIVYFFVTMFVRINVPLFLMISGTLLLEKEEPYKDILRKRVSRFSIVIILFEIGLYVEEFVIAQIKGREFTFSVFEIIRNIVSNGLDSGNLYWYLYSYLGMLLMLPFLRKIAKGMDKQSFILLIVFHFILSSLVPMINTILFAIGAEAIVLPSSFTGAFALATIKPLFYPLIGYYLDRRVDIEKIKRKQVILLSVAGVISIVLPSVLAYFESITTTYRSAENYVQAFDYMTAMVVFLLVKKASTINFAERILNKWGNLIASLGILTFGIYLLDPCFRLLLWNRFQMLLEPYLPALSVSVLWCLFSMLLGGTITWILRKMPGFKKIL